MKRLTNKSNGFEEHQRMQRRRENMEEKNPFEIDLLLSHPFKMNVITIFGKQRLIDWLDACWKDRNTKCILQTKKRTERNENI